MSYSELSNLEKIEILKNHVRNFEYAQYNLEVEVIAEQASTNANSMRVLDLQSQIDDINAKQQALEEEITRLESL
jgi:ubiquinone biosynthesis protein UbiJ